jgi:hypothetical protein
MLHIIVYSKECVLIQADHGSCVINPTFASQHKIFDQLRIEDGPIKAVFLTHNQYEDLMIQQEVVVPLILPARRVGEHMGFSYEFIDTNILISVQGKKILYCVNPLSEELVRPLPVCDVIACDISQGIEPAIILLQHVRAENVFPLNTPNSDEAIEFCRRVMLDRLGTPKYLKPDQYLVLP